ncbi:MAG: glutamate synthase [Eggerthellaceae bacterium]|nr:glutamate synthase [Eggerthellaceae bacterium]
MATATKTVTLGTAHFKEANELVREALAQADTLDIQQAHAQRYLGAAMPVGKRLEIHGTPGNDLGCYMDGGQIEVFGNAQDQVGNTMNHGSIVIHGRCGDAAGYGMRGGEILVRDDCGWRVGVHMKEYQEHRPAIVIGGDAGNFLGEYLAGGIIVLMGKPGKHLATGMHGGVIYLAHRLDAEDVPAGLVLEPTSKDDQNTLRPLLERFEKFFGSEREDICMDPSAYWSLRPASSRPYGSMYA